MSYSKVIKKAMIDKNLKVSDLGATLAVDPKVLSVKLSRDNLNGKSLQEFADALNCDVVLQDRENGKIYS